MKPENIEFIALFEASGWSKSETARRLGDMDRSSIGRFLTGEIAPSAPVLKLFKLILASEKPGALSAIAELHEESLAEWERKVVEDLRWLHIEDRDRVLKTIRAMVDGLPRRAPVSYTSPKKLSFVEKSPEEKFVDEIEAEADRMLAREDSRKRVKPLPRRSASGHPKKPNAQ